MYLSCFEKRRMRSWSTSSFGRATNLSAIPLASTVLPPAQAMLTLVSERSASWITRCSRTPMISRPSDSAAFENEANRFAVSLNS